MINTSLSLISLTLSLSQTHTHTVTTVAPLFNVGTVWILSATPRERRGLGWGWGKGVSILCQILLFQKKINYKVTNRKREGGRERVVYYYILQKDYHGSLSFHHHPISFTVTLFFSPLNSPIIFFPPPSLFLSLHYTFTYIYIHTHRDTQKDREREREILCLAQ